jgi:hypothetical protein
MSVALGQINNEGNLIHVKYYDKQKELYCNLSSYPEFKEKKIGIKLKEPDKQKELISERINIL